LKKCTNAPNVETTMKQKRGIFEMYVEYLIGCSFTHIYFYFKILASKEYHK